MEEVDILRTEIESGKQFKTVLQGFDKKEVTDTVTRLMVENAELSDELDRVRLENKNLKKQLRDMQLEYADYGERMPMGEVPTTPSVDIDAVREEVAQEYQAQITDLEIKLQKAQKAAVIAMKKASDSQAEAKKAREQSAEMMSQADSAWASGADSVNFSVEDIESAKHSMDVNSRVIVDTLKAQIEMLNVDKKQKNLRIAELEDMLQQEKDEMQAKLAYMNSINTNMMAALQEKIEDLSEFTDEWAESYRGANV